MTPDQERHLADIKKSLEEFVDTKYRMGAKEHGGDLQDMSPLVILNCAIEEAIDQFIYLTTLRASLLKTKL